jgi:hypothetical protein
MLDVQYGLLGLLIIGNKCSTKLLAGFHLQKNKSHDKTKEPPTKSEALFGDRNIKRAWFTGRFFNYISNTSDTHVSYD